MGLDYDLGMAFAKSQMAAGGTLPTKGNVFISVKETDRPNVVRIAKGYADLGFTLYATSGTGSVITDAGLPVNILPKLASGQRPNVIDLMKNKDMALVINTPTGKKPREDDVQIRTAAMHNCLVGKDGEHSRWSSNSPMWREELERVCRREMLPL